MKIIIIFLIAIFGILFYILSQTLLFHPKPYKNIFSMSYTSCSDILISSEKHKKLLIFLGGMYSNPQTFEKYAKEILQYGWDVYIPALPNFSKSNKDLYQQASFQWEDSLKIAIHKILQKSHSYEKIVLSGFSQGGSLALTIAPSFLFLDALILIGTPLNLLHSKQSLVKQLGVLFSGIIYFMTKDHKIFIKSKRGKDLYHCLTVHSMQIGLKQTRKNLKKITQKTLLLFNKYDPIVDIKDASKIKNDISGNAKEIILESEDPLYLHNILKNRDLGPQISKHIIKFLEDL